MSKIGAAPITVPAGITVDVQQKVVTVKGSNQELRFELPLQLDVEKMQDTVLVKRNKEDKKTKSLHGLYRVLIANAVAGIQKPWEKRLEVVGTGFNVKLQGEDLVFKVGYSHPVVFKKQQGITYKVEGNNKVAVSGADRQLVGQVAFQIKMIKMPDAYKGKGIRYEGEHIKLKPGKKAKTA